MMRNSIWKKLERNGRNPNREIAYETGFKLVNASGKPIDH